MKRSEQAERIRHNELLRKWADTVGADREARWLKNLMLCILVAVPIVVAIYVLAWWLR